MKKLREISKFTTSHTGKETIKMDILPDVARSKDIQAMKL